jgi:hypothetical protein
MRPARATSSARVRNSLVDANGAHAEGDMQLVRARQVDPSAQ